MDIRDQPPMEVEMIIELGRNDVLCGRGVTTNRHEGNVQYRSLVALYKEEYVTSTKKQKMKISRNLVQAIRSLNPPGRFLDKDPSTGHWFDIGDRKAIEKTSQALRDGAKQVRQQLSQDLSDPSFLTAIFSAEEEQQCLDDSFSNLSSSTTTVSSTSSAAKDNKAKAPVKARRSSVKKGHRRTKSNPHTLAEKNTVMMRRETTQNNLMEDDDFPIPPVLSPMNSLGSLPPLDQPQPPNYNNADDSFLHKAASLDQLDFSNEDPTFAVQDFGFSTFSSL